MNHQRPLSETGRIADLGSERRRPGRLAIVLLPLLALLASGCFGDSGKTKAGVESQKTLTLIMQAPDGDDADTDYFAAEVKRRTNGRIRILIGGDYSSLDPDNELRLARTLRRGDVKLGYLTSRAWERDDISTFRALQAPFLITDYKLLDRVVKGRIGARMLRSLGRVGLVGLGLVPNELRRPLGRHPLVSPSAYRGARIRVVTSPASQLMVRALGARPVTNLDAKEALVALRLGQLDGVESSTHFIEANSYAGEAPYLPSNLALFAKTETIVMGKRFFTRLSAADQAALREAAAATVAHADPAAEERTEVRRLCQRGLRLVQATGGDLESLRRAAAPAYAVLERDPFTKRAVTEIKRLKGRTLSSRATLPACSRVVGTSPAGSNTAFPSGTFETRITPTDLRGTGFPTSNAHFERLTFNKDRTWRDVWFHPRRADQPPFGGRYTVRGGIVTLVPANPDVLKWSYYRGVLTFRIVSVPDDFARFTYTVHPWRKVK